MLLSLHQKELQPFCLPLYQIALYNSGSMEDIQWKTTCQLKLMLDALRPLLNQDLPITNLLLTTPTRDSVKTQRSVSLLGV